MTLTELLEADKEKLLAQITEAGTPDLAGKVCEKELDRLLYQYNEEEGTETEKDKAYLMLRAARAMAGLIDTMGETRVWEKRDASEKKDAKFSPLSAVLLGAGVVAAAFYLILGISGGGFFRGGFAPLAASAAMALFWLSGWTGNRSGKAARGQMETEVRVDPERVFRALRAVALTMDRDLADVRSQEKWEQKKQTRESARTGVENHEIDFFAGLLETVYTESGDLPEAVRDDAVYYLRSKGITAVDYTEEHDSWFEKIPAKRGSTIRPALVLEDGSLVKKGVAAKLRG